MHAYHCKDPGMFHIQREASAIDNLDSFFIELRASYDAAEQRHIQYLQLKEKCRLRIQHHKAKSAVIEKEDFVSQYFQKEIEELFVRLIQQNQLSERGKDTPTKYKNEMKDV